MSHGGAEPKRRLLKGAALLLSILTLGSAPFQCSSQADPSEAIEETPAEALYVLAQRFREEGDEKAWRRTLKHLIEQYPSSHFATTAKHDLGEE